MHIIKKLMLLFMFVLIAYNYLPEKSGYGFESNHLGAANEGNQKKNYISILSYNVANYDNDTMKYISEDKMFNFKSLINHLNTDFICIQEDNEYVDEGKKCNSFDILFSSKYMYKVGKNGTTIMSKFKQETDNVLLYSNGRILRYALYYVDENAVIVVSTHMIANYENTGFESEKSIRARQIQYDEMMKWVSGEISLMGYLTSIPVYCPDWDYCIICGDFNSITDEDKNNLKTIVSDRGYCMLNGGEKEWFSTCYQGHDIDNIIVSPNIKIIDSVVYDSWYTDLYSDHYPLYALIELVDNTHVSEKNVGNMNSKFINIDESWFGNYIEVLLRMIMVRLLYISRVVYHAFN